MQVELLIVDTTQIQSYVFGSNRLRENLGASYLVSQATREWVADTLPYPIDVTKLASQPPIESGERSAEIVYIGGGNALILFSDPQLRQTFMYDYSRKLLQYAPNLQVAFACSDKFDWDDWVNNPLPAVINSVTDQLKIEKRDRPRSVPLLGVGVSAACQSTGFPATFMTPPAPGLDRDPVSAEIHAKRINSELASDRLKKFLPLSSEYRYPYDLDNLGRSKDEHSTIAIVHADGDGFGDWLRGFGDTAENNRACVQQRRAISQKIAEVAQQTMRITLNILLNNIEVIDGEHVIRQVNAFGEQLSAVVLQQGRKKDESLADWWFVPFRPIVFGGDDITFICDGRIALALTTIYQKQFKQQMQQKCGQALSASAGIAIVKSHYPFARAYNLAEQLAASAKQYRHFLHKTTGYTDGCIDWHFALGGLLGDMETIRNQHYCAAYTVNGQPTRGALTLRPLTIIANPEIARPYRAWPIVKELVAVFQDDEDVIGDVQQPQWSTRRNKVKALRDTLRAGPAAVKRFITTYRLQKGLPTVYQGLNGFNDEGWHNNYCGYFDAIELIDWYIPLKEEAGNANDN